MNTDTFTATLELSEPWNLSFEVIGVGKIIDLEDSKAIYFNAITGIDYLLLPRYKGDYAGDILNKKELIVNILESVNFPASLKNIINTHEAYIGYGRITMNNINGV